MRRLRLWALLLAAAGPASSASPAWALGGSSTGANLNCGQNSSPQAIVQYATWTQISGSGGIACAPPGGDNHFPNVIAPVTVASQPQPYYAMRVVQEEGVPVIGGQ